MWPKLWAVPPPTRPFLVTATNTLVIAGACWYHGAVILETGGAAAATVQVFDGLTATGIPIDALKAAISGVDRSGPNQVSILCERGIFVTVTGSVVFTMTVLALPAWREINVADPDIADVFGEFPG